MFTTIIGFPCFYYYNIFSIGKTDIYPIDILKHGSTKPSTALFIEIHVFFIRYKGCKGCVNVVTVRKLVAAASFPDLADHLINIEENYAMVKVWEELVNVTMT